MCQDNLGVGDCLHNACAFTLIFDMALRWLAQGKWQKGSCYFYEPLQEKEDPRYAIADNLQRFSSHHSSKNLFLLCVCACDVSRSRKGEEKAF